LRVQGTCGAAFDGLAKTPEAGHLDHRDAATIRRPKATVSALGSREALLTGRFRAGKYIDHWLVR
jgi:hypothetical protein